MCSDLSLFDSYEPLNDSCPLITIPNGTKLHVKYKGVVKPGMVTLHDVLHVPGFQFNLISIAKLCQDDAYFVSFIDKKCLLQDLSMNKRILLGKLEKGLYIMDNSITHAATTTPAVPS